MSSLYLSRRGTFVPSAAWLPIRVADCIRSVPCNRLMSQDSIDLKQRGRPKQNLANRLRSPGHRSHRCTPGRNDVRNVACRSLPAKRRANADMRSTIANRRSTSHRSQIRGISMGKNPNSFQKRQREIEKKRKAQDKRDHRLAKKNNRTPER